MSEETLDIMWSSGYTSHPRERLFAQFLFALDRSPAMHPHLKVIVKILIRVQLRRIRRQIEQLYLLMMFINPLGNRLAVMSSEIVKDEIDLPACIPDKSPHELDQQLCRHLKSGFISPVDFRLLLPRTLRYGWIFLLQPQVDLFRVLFVCPLDRLAHCEPPALEVFSYCTDGHLDPITMPYQFPDCLPRPQCKGKFYLVGQLVCQKMLALSPALYRESSYLLADVLRASPVWPSFLLSVFLPHAACVLLTYSDHPCCFPVCSPFSPETDDLEPKFLQNLFADLSSISFFHPLSLNLSLYLFQLFCCRGNITI